MSVFFLGGSILLASLSKSSVVPVFLFLFFLLVDARGVDMGLGRPVSWCRSFSLLIRLFCLLYRWLPRRSHLLSCPLLRRPREGGRGWLCFPLFKEFSHCFPLL